MSSARAGECPGRCVVSLSPCEKLFLPVDHPIQVEQLQKSYGSFAAVKGIDFEVRAGEVFGLLGPNGAGKTSTVEILEGLRSRSGGRVSVLGCDPEVQTRQLKDRIGVCLQDTNLQEKIKVREAIELFSSLYTRTVDGMALLKRLQLWEKREALYTTLSGGQKQRLALALALLNDPQVLFLDEPSAGLDPQARLEIHELVQELRREQRTILLTTHYIEEAEKLCDRVAIVDEGRIVAMGTPREIQERTLSNSVIEIEIAQPLGDAELPVWPEADNATIFEGRTHIAVVSRRPARTIVAMVKWLDDHGIELSDIRIKRPSLEEAFIELTGKSLRE
jgi:ABC-2 type transport system ATP-binding protein